MVLKRILDWHANRQSGLRAASVVEAGAQLRQFKTNMERFLASGGFDAAKMSFDYQVAAFVFTRIDEVLSDAGLVDDIEGGSVLRADMHQRGAITVLVVQGLHMIFAEAFAPTVLSSDDTKRRRAAVLENTLRLVLRVQKDNPDEGLGVLAYGSALYKQVAANDMPLLQSVYDAWAAWFTSDDTSSADKLQSAFHRITAVSRG
ncbi:hypothetical protein LRP31_35025 (plasmid) [Mesorhizobium mediterraneum]|uniref:Uncharacterized protein n=1 Tax=Mesorhizobium mediterraneum TaxID=43617 RepID=A0AB36RGR2_9HYPH|nr:hypothetical protein [Mesorhizobium mediterraneum]PAQ03771.1 hypothetical protein CIT25_02940 [Mesorhizobium mediterraneum]WIW57344.1 hypothetical protein LRP31_35025 [Mesorhizobium mediterraneum]